MIKCHDHDYIEIACLYHYPIRIELKSGEILEGIAVDTERNETREECIKVSADGKEQLVVLDEISRLKVRVENPHFDEVSFS